MSRGFYEEVADALVGFLPPSLRGFSSRVSSRNLKVWYGDDAAVHYEVQLVAATASGGRARRPALEVGLHAEHASPGRNEEVVALLRARERSWRRALGPEAVAGAFLGRQREWRRLSELWEGPHVESPEAAVEAADRLARYIRTLEPMLVSPGRASGGIRRADAEEAR